MASDEDGIEVYQLHILLRGISPAIWRRVLVRSDTAVDELHATIQIAMGWIDECLHCFRIQETRAKCGLRSFWHVRVPLVEGSAEVAIESSGPDLKQQVGAGRCPAHLLLLDHAPGDDLVDRRLDEPGGDALAIAHRCPYQKRLAGRSSP